jgi:coenzyme F420-reducing hydrogenase delta subunit
VNELLRELGWGSDRIKSYGLFSADVNKFNAAIQEALERFNKVGHSPARLRLMKKSEE